MIYYLASGSVFYVKIMLACVLTFCVLSFCSFDLLVHYKLPVCSVLDVIVNKLHLQKVTEFSIPIKGIAPYHIAAYVPGSKVCSSNFYSDLNLHSISTLYFSVDVIC